MAKFMCSHTLSPGAMTDNVFGMFAQVAQEDRTVKGYRSFMNLTEGKIVCILEAADRKTVEAWFEMMTMPYDEIVRVEYEGHAGRVERV